MRVGFREGEFHGGLVVAGELLRLDFRLDGGLHRGLDLEQALDVLADLAGGVGGIRFREILFVDAARREWRVLPCLVRREGEDGCEELRDATEDLVHRGLRGEAARGIRGVAIHAVFQRVDVDRGKVGGAELVDGVEDLAELEGLVSCEALLGDRVEALEDPSV